MEEDITLLEEMKENCLLKRDYIDVKAERKATAIENILSDYKRIQEEFKQVDHECERLEQKEVRLEKENEELKEERDAIYSDYQYLGKEKWEADEAILFLTERLENSISKQKIKDKIEELNKKIASEENEKVILWLHKQRNVLQDLLESDG